jgi:repressor LexA
VQLLPENPDFAPIVVDLREQVLSIEGLGVGVLRLGMADRAGGGARRL